MPAILDKTDTLNGCVFRYEGRDGYYYRELIPNTKRYRVKRIPEATTLSEAIRDAYKVLLIFNSTNTPEPQPRRTTAASRHRTIADHIEDWLAHSEKLVIANIKDGNAHKRRCVTLRKHLTAYLSVVDISDPKLIDETTFDNYILFRKGLSKNTIKTELKEIGIFIRYWLRRYSGVTNEIALSPTLLPRIKLSDEDLSANPAISENDYHQINLWIRNTWVPRATNCRSRYFRQMYWTFIHILKNSGMRPIELLNARIMDITITNRPRWSWSTETDKDEYYASIFVRRSKTGKQREAVCRSNAGDRLIKFRQYQKDWFSRYQPSFKFTEETLLFGSPEQLMEKTYSHRYLNDVWRKEIINPIRHRLEGNKFSAKPYTIYSLRSTFIENCILDDINIYTVATLCGNSVKTIQKYYDRHDILKKMEDIQQIHRGAKKREVHEEFKLL
jgi:hypothetical protein